MDSVLIIKISAILAVLSTLSTVVFGTWAFLRGRYVRAVQKQSFSILTDVKKGIFQIVSQVTDGSSNSISVEREVQKAEVTPDDHVEVSKILREVEKVMSGQDYEEAEKLLIQALSYNTEDEDVNSLLGFIYLKRKKYLKAESMYVHMIERGTKDPAVYGNLSKALEYQEKYDLAIIAARQAIELDLHNAARFVALASLYMSRDMVSEALQAYADALQKGGRNIEIFKIISPILIKEMRYEDAARINNEILELEPYNEEAKLLLLELKDKGYLAS